MLLSRFFLIILTLYIFKFILFFDNIHSNYHLLYVSAIYAISIGIFHRVHKDGNYTNLDLCAYMTVHVSFLFVDVV